MSLSYHRGRDLSNLKFRMGRYGFPNGEKAAEPKREGSAAEGVLRTPRRSGACRSLRLWDGGGGGGRELRFSPPSRGGLASPAGRSRPSLGLSARGGFFSLAGADSRLWAASRPSPSPWERPPRRFRERRRSRLLGASWACPPTPSYCGVSPLNTASRAAAKGEADPFRSGVSSGSWGLRSLASSSRGGST